MVDELPDADRAIPLTLPPDPDATQAEPPETPAELKARLEKQLALLKGQIARRKEAEDALRRESAMLRLLGEVAAAANQAETIEEAFQFALDRICAHTGWPVGHVFLLANDDDGEIVSARLWHGDEGERYRAFRETTEASRFAPGEGWLGEIFRAGRSAWIADVAEEPDFVRARSLDLLEVRSGFAFPVLVGDEVTAVLEFYTPEAVAPDEGLLEAMAYIGTQLGRVVERARAREARQRHQALLANAERLASLGSWEWDVRGNTVDWSDELHRIYGLSREEFGRSLESFLDWVHPADREEVAARVREATERGIAFRFHHRIIRPDGGVRTLLAHGQPVLDENGALRRMFGTGQDVTEQREVEARLAHRAEQLVALSAMGQMITTTLELETVFDTVLGRLRPLLGAAGVFILLREGDELVFAATSEERARDLTGKRLPAATGVAGEALRDGRAVGHFGREAGRRVFPQIAESTGYRPGALLVAPLILRGEAIGLMEAMHPDPAAFGEEDLRLLETAAAWTAIAIGNARLFEREQAARQAAEMLREASLQMTRSLDLETVLQTLLDHLLELMRCDMSSVKLMDGDRLVVGAVRGRPQQDQGYQLAALPADHPLRQIAASGRSLHVPDTTAYAGWDDRLGGRDAVRSWIGVPLLAGGRLIGVYTAGSAQADYFEERHLLLAEALAGQAAIAVQNARLFTQVRRSQERLRYLTWRVVTAQEAERRRVSRELHDEAGQALTALKISLDLIRAALPGDQAATAARLAEAVALVDATMEQIRLLAHDLRPPVLDTFGLNPSLEGFCDDFARRTGLAIHYEGVDLPELPDAAQISLYRFLQEALTNAARHGEASEIRVVLRRDRDHARLTVQDNGRGFAVEPTLAAQRGGVGLLGMQERIELLGGRVSVRSAPGEGTDLAATVPLNTEPMGGAG